MTDMVTRITTCVVDIHHRVPVSEQMEATT
jgi:hypothetical protein